MSALEDELTVVADRGDASLEALPELTVQLEQLITLVRGYVG